jgi:post-segregation antitoxin (ccd killing protein)
MPRTTIYLPDELAEAARELDIPLSRLCQEAIAREVTRRAEESSIPAEARVGAIARRAFEDVGSTGGVAGAGNESYVFVGNRAYPRSFDVDLLTGERVRVTATLSDTPPWSRAPEIPVRSRAWPSAGKLIGVTDEGRYVVLVEGRVVSEEPASLKRAMFEGRHPDGRWLLFDDPELSAAYWDPWASTPDGRRWVERR